MATDQAPRLSSEEYLAFERASELRHEFVDGVVRERPPNNRRHSLIYGNLAGMFHGQLRNAPFEVLGLMMRIRTPDACYYYPDLLLAPSPPELEDEFRDTLLNPVVLVEILSPATERFDRGEKRDDYRLIPSLTDFLTVAQDEVWIDRHVRTGDRWRLET